MVAFRIARRFLGASKGQTALIVFGIAIGVAVQVFVGILIMSLQSSLINGTIGNSSQVTIKPAGDNATLSDWQPLMEAAEGTAGTKSVSPAADSSAFLLRSGRTVPILLRGFDLDRADRIYKLKDRLYEGKLPSAPNEVLTGRELNAELGLKLGDTVELFTSGGAYRNLTIAGFYDLKVAAINKQWLVSTLGTSQQVFGFGPNITSIEMQVDEIFKADQIAKDVSRKAGRADIKVLDWKTENSQLLSGLQGQSLSSYMIQVFVLTSVIIAIASVLAIKVLQKSKEVGILKAMGIRDGQAGLIFLYQGLMLGIGGALLGVFLAVFLLTGFTMGARNADGSSLIEITFDYVFIAGSGLIAIISATLAAALPARTTTRLNPIEVIRNG